MANRTTKTKKRPRRLPRGTRVVGRPSLFSVQIGRQICRYVADGTPLAHAARAVGVSHSTLNDWRQKGLVAMADGDYAGEYARFAQELEIASGRAVASRVRNIKSAGESGDWRADAWHLERTTEDFRRKQSVEHSGQIVRQSVEINLSANLSPDQMLLFGALLAQALPAQQNGPAENPAGPRTVENLADQTTSESAPLNMSSDAPGISTAAN